MCPDEEEEKVPSKKNFSSNRSLDMVAQQRRSYVLDAVSNETMPNSRHKVSPRQVSPNISQGSGFTSNGGFHIPLTMCEKPGSDQSSQEDVSYHLENPQIMKQPTAKTRPVPPLLLDKQEPFNIRVSSASYMGERSDNDS